MQFNPRFSVIIPIYKVESFLPKCVESLLNQNYTNVEIILVDDGSPDNCPDICDKFKQKDARIKIVHKKNGGLVSARKAGCEIATGQYILNVDGDDWVKPDYFEELDKIVEAYSPDYICFGSYHVQGDEETPHKCNIKGGLYTRNEIVRDIFPYLIENEKGQYFSPSVWSKAIRRELYVQAQMNVDDLIKIGEDHACTKPALVKAETVFVSDKCLYCYRLNPLSMTKEKKAFSWDGPELIGRNFEKQVDMKLADFQDQVYRNVVHNLFNVVVSQFYRKDKMTVILRDIRANLNRKYYQNAINHCKYAKTYHLGNATLILLKRKMLWVIFLLSKIYRSNFLYAMKRTLKIVLVLFGSEMLGDENGD